MKVTCFLTRVLQHHCVVFLKEQCRSCYSHSDDPVESLSVSARRAAPTRQPEQPVCQTCVIKLQTQEQYLVRDLTSWSASWWVQIKHRDKLCSDLNLLRRNDTDRQFPQNALDSCKSFLKNTPSVSTTIFFPTGSNFHFDQTISLQKLNSNRENYSEQWSAHRRLEGEFHLSFSETWVE